MLVTAKLINQVQQKAHNILLAFNRWIHDFLMQINVGVFDISRQLFERRSLLFDAKAEDCISQNFVFCAQKTYILEFLDFPVLLQTRLNGMFLKINGHF